MSTSAFEWSIPDEFQVMGMNVKVTFDPKLNRNTEGHLGRAVLPTAELRLQEPTESLDIDEGWLKMTFLHEVVHCALNSMGYDELNENEVFIEQLSSILYQVIKTSVIYEVDEYEEGDYREDEEEDKEVPFPSEETLTENRKNSTDSSDKGLSFSDRKALSHVVGLVREDKGIADDTEGIICVLSMMGLFNDKKELVDNLIQAYSGKSKEELLKEKDD